MTPNYTIKGVPFYSVETVTGNKWENTKFISEDIFQKESKRVILQKGDILMTRIGDIGTAKLIDWDVRASFYVSLALFKNKSCMSFKFLIHYIGYHAFQHELYKNTIHVAFPKKINLSEINKCHIVSPPLNEQERIAEILSTWDDAIIKQEQLITQKELFKKGIMQQIFSQKIRFKDENGNNYPTWQSKKLGELDIFISDGNYGELYPKSHDMKNSGVPFIRANNIKNLCLVWDNMKFIDNDLHLILTSGHLKTDDILITTRGEIGMLARVTEEFNGSNINAQICLLRVPECLNSRFLLQFLSSSYGKIQFKSLQTGSALKQLPKSSLENIKVNFPAIPEEQTKIANVLTNIDDEINKQIEILKQLKLQKQALMQKLLTGKMGLTI